MSDIVLNEQITGRDTNFQVVGCTIDAGSKIYAARVDALHQNTYQMLSGLGNHNQDGSVNDDNNNNNSQNGADNGNDNDENEGDDNNKKKEKKKRRAKKSTQIVENLDQITSKLNEDFVNDDDIYFSRISTSIEQEAIGGLLMNKLNPENDLLNLLINKDDVYFNIQQEHKIQDQIFSIKSFSEIASKFDVHNLKCCEDLTKFTFLGWNLDANDEITRLCENLNEDLEKDRFNEDSNIIDLHENERQQQMELENLNNSLHLDIGDIDNDDMGIDIGMENYPAPISNSSISAVPNAGILDDVRASKSIANMTTLLQHTSQLHSEYSYFNFDKLKLHDLPKHLKAFAVKVSNLAQENETDQQQQMQSTQMKDRRKKEAQKIDMQKLSDHSKFLKVTKKAIFLSNRVIENRFEKTFNLESERELDYDARQLFQPYYKKINAKLFSEDAIEEVGNLLVDNNNNNQTLVANEGIHDGDLLAGNNEDDDYGMGHDNFDIPGTSEPPQFFTQNGVHEFNLATQMPNTQQSNDVGTMVFDGDNLVQAPEQVNALHIAYAKKAKNIDPKMLKREIWNLLCKHSASNEKVIVFVKFTLLFLMQSLFKI